MGQFFCGSCRDKIEFFDVQVCPYCERPNLYGLTHPRCAKKDGLDGMFVLAHYRGPIREAIRQIKYTGAYTINKELAKMIVAKYHAKFSFDYLTPVPLANKRENERGFNQAEKLARELGNVLCIKYYGKLLVRIRETKPQFDLKQEDRLKNVQKAFALSPAHNTYPIIHNTFVCLVDDVATTGATIFECAKVLKSAGAAKVYAICVARGG